VRSASAKFQTPTIYEDLTVFEKLELSVRAAATCSAPCSGRHQRGDRAGARGRGDDLSGGAPRSLGGDVLVHGQKQWLEIGMLLIQDPRLLMLDEPVAGMSVSGAGEDRRAAQ